MLVMGYVFAIRSERLICREVQVNLAYRWFCKLGIEDAIALRPIWLVVKALQLMRASLLPMPTSSARSKVRIGAGIVIPRGPAAR